jgi:hypothetical protein
MPKAKCTVSGCDNFQNAKGYCGKHYARWKKHGDPDVVAYSTAKSARVDGFVESGFAKCRHHGRHVEWRLKDKVDAKGKTYRSLECKLCMCERSKTWRLKNPELHKIAISTLRVTASRLISGAKRRSKMADLPFDISVEWLISRFEAQGGRCSLSGRQFQLEYTTGGRRENAMSLDQIVPGAGYTTGNTQVVVWCVNEMKKRMSQDQFLTLCCDVSQHFKMKA